MSAEYRAWSRYLGTVRRHVVEAHAQWCDATRKPGADWRAAEARFFELGDWLCFAKRMCELHSRGRS